MKGERQAPLLRARGLGRFVPVAGEASGGWLLRSVDLELWPGERLGLAGPSGAGKTLLLRALAALDPIQSGHVEFQGRPLQRVSLPMYRSRVVYLHQRPSVGEGPAEESLREVFLLGVHRGRDYRRERVLAYLEHLGRDASFLERPGSKLSGGEVQIVAFIRALQLEPQVLLLDEPTAALDEGSTRAIELLVGRWLEEDRSRAVIWASHDEAQLSRMTGRILRLREGRLEGRTA